MIVSDSSLYSVRPVNVPVDYRELYVLYREQIRSAVEEAGVPGAVFMNHLRDARVVETFDPARYVPSQLNHSEAIAYLGVSEKFWKGFVRHYEYREQVFTGETILRIAGLLDRKGYPRNRPTCVKSVEAFRNHLCGSLSQVKANLQSKPTSQPVEPVKDPWPSDLPRDNNQMVRMYSSYVFDQIRRVSKIKTPEELEEVSQVIWLDILKAKVLEKFLEASKTKLPRTLTLTEALGYLGVTHDQWKAEMATHEQDRSEHWMPAPILGAACAPDALFLTSDIQTLDESAHFLVNARVEERVRPGLSGRGFKSYLAKTVRNHFKNLLRTRFRRHKERGLDPRTVLSGDGMGSYHKAMTLEDSGNWEDGLTDVSSGDVTMEDMMDIVAKLRKYDVDPRSEKGMFVIDYMARGHSIKDALKAHTRSIAPVVHKLRVVAA